MTYTYDDNGNRTSRTAGGVTTMYSYNVVDQLVLTTDTRRAGRVRLRLPRERIKKIDSDGETRYLYGGSVLLLEYAANGGTLASTTTA